MESDSVFNLFYAIVSGKYRPHLFNSNSNFPSFEGRMINKDTVYVEALDGFLLEEDNAYADLSVKIGKYAIENKVVGTICDEFENYTSKVHIPKPNSIKTTFYFTLLKTAFCLSVSRIVMKQWATSSDEFKVKYSNELISHLTILIKDLDKYETQLHISASTYLNEENSFAIGIIRKYLFNLLVISAKCFKGYCHSIYDTIEIWENVFYGPRPDRIQEYKQEWPLDLKAKAIIANVQFQQPTKAEYIILFRNIAYLKHVIPSDYGDYLFCRVHGKASLLQWLIYKDRDHVDSIILSSDLPKDRLAAIAENEQQLYNEFVDIVYSEVFLKVFEKVLPANRIRIATDDLKSIDGIIDNTISNDKMRIFSQAYDIQRSLELIDSIQKVLRGTVYETKGYAILKHAEAEALIRYKDFLSDFLINGKSNSSSAKQDDSNRSAIIQSSFGFKGDRIKLKNCLDFLQLKLSKGLVDIKRSRIDDLVLTLLSDFDSKDSKSLIFSCETTQLAYILRNIGSCFTYLTDDSIHNTGLFITNNNAKLTKSNLRKSLSSCSNRPKDVEIIDLAVLELIGKNSN